MITQKDWTLQVTELEVSSKVSDCVIESPVSQTDAVSFFYQGDLFTLVHVSKQTFYMSHSYVNTMTLHNVTSGEKFEVDADSPFGEAIYLKYFA